MSEEHFQEPAPQARSDTGDDLREGALADIAISILGAAGWDAIKATGRTVIGRHRVRHNPPVDVPICSDNDYEGVVDLTVDGNWDEPIDFNDFD